MNLLRYMWIFACPHLTFDAWFGVVNCPPVVLAQINSTVACQNPKTGQPELVEMDVTFLKVRSTTGAFNFWMCVSLHKRRYSFYKMGRAHRLNLLCLIRGSSAWGSVLCFGCKAQARAALRVQSNPELYLRPRYFVTGKSVPALCHFNGAVRQFVKWIVGK